MTHDHSDDEPALNSELIWSFNNVKTQLLDAYPNGKSLTDILTTVDGLYEWQIDFYPNGTDSKNNKLSVRLTLKNVKDGLSNDVDAECNYYLINKESNQNFVGRIPRRNFQSDASEEDSDFDNQILKDFNSDCLITFCITQFLVENQETNDVKTTNLVSSPNESLNFLDEDSKIESVKQLY